MILIGPLLKALVSIRGDVQRALAAGDEAVDAKVGITTCSGCDEIGDDLTDVTPILLGNCLQLPMGFRRDGDVDTDFILFILLFLSLFCLTMTSSGSDGVDGHGWECLSVHTLYTRRTHGVCMPQETLCRASQLYTHCTHTMCTKPGDYTMKEWSCTMPLRTNGWSHFCGQNLDSWTVLWTELRQL